jgi:hypothetical protein
MLPPDAPHAQCRRRDALHLANSITNFLWIIGAQTFHQFTRGLKSLPTAAEIAGPPG